MYKALLPQVRYLVLNGIRGRRSVVMEQVGERGVGQFMEGFTTEKHTFEMNPALDSKPIKLLEYRSGVIMGGISE